MQCLVCDSISNNTPLDEEGMCTRCQGYYKRSGLELNEWLTYRLTTAAKNYNRKKRDRGDYHKRYYDGSIPDTLTSSRICLDASMKLLAVNSL